MNVSLLKFYSLVYCDSLFASNPKVAICENELLSSLSLNRQTHYRATSAKRLKGTPFSRFHARLPTVRLLFPFSFPSPSSFPALPPPLTLKS